MRKFPDKHQFPKSTLNLQEGIYVLSFMLDQVQRVVELSTRGFPPQLKTSSLSSTVHESATFCFAVEIKDYKSRRISNP